MAAVQGAGGLAGQHLPAVGGGADPRRVVDVDTPVVAVVEAGLAGVQPDSDPDAVRPASGRPRVGGERALSGDRRVDGRLGVGEGDEERVALGADLDPLVPGPHRAQQPAMVGEHRAVPSPSWSSSRVEPSMSVNSIVTVPEGSVRVTA